MKKILFLIIFTTLMFGCVNVYAHGVSKYGYPSKNMSKSIFKLTNSFNITINKDYVHYAEHDSNGSTLDNEDAIIPGVNLSLEGIPNSKIPIWYELNYSDYYGNSTYTGATQITDIPIENTDHIGYINYGFRVGYAFIIDDNKLAIIPNAGFEWMDWNRNILDNAGNTEYIEHYHFNRYLLGIKAYYLITNRLWLAGEGYYTHGTDNSMDTNALVPTALVYNNSGNYIGELGNYESQNFELGNRSGFLFGIKIGYQVYKSKTINIGPFISLNYSQLKVNKSNTITYYNIPQYTYPPANLVGYTNYTVDEPQSQTNQLFIGFGIKLGF